MTPTLPVLLASLTLCLTVSPCHAQLSLDKQQGDNWYATQLGALSLLAIGSAAALSDAEAVSAPRLRRAPEFERDTEQNDSRITSRVSDVTLLSTLALPLGSLYVTRRGASYQNGLLIYGQATTASLLVNSITKQLVLRARPFTHRTHKMRASPDENYSFYSGHSALAFTAATSGSALFSATEESSLGSSAHWGLSFALASFTAHARVRAGRHYPSDVLFGALVGTGLGLFVPAIHRLPIKASPRDLAAASTGVAAGSLAAFLLPRRPRRTLMALSPRFLPIPSGGVLMTSGRF